MVQKKPRPKKYSCLDCGRKISHKGRCFPCNKERKNRREGKERTTYKDKHGYEREHSNALHRRRAYTEIYLENREDYPKPFSHYEVHHKDFNKTNNRVSNLQILTPTEHDKIHEHKDEFIKNFADKRRRRKNIFTTIYFFVFYLAGFILALKMGETFGSSLLFGLVGIVAGVLIFLIFFKLIEPFM